MDLLTPTPTSEEQQELSTRALRVCLAAEAALASLRAECSPSQSSLSWLADSGSRNLELAHRSLQLPIDACESLALCATAAFKQLCDAHFLPSSRKGVLSSQLAHGRYPSPRLCSEEHESSRNWKCQACKGDVHPKSEVKPRKGAPNRSDGDSFSSLLCMEQEETPGDFQMSHIDRPLLKFRPSTPCEPSHQHLKGFVGRSPLSEPRSPTEFCGEPHAQALSKGHRKPNTVDQIRAALRSMEGPPYSGFENKFMTFEGLQPRPCSSSKQYAEGSGSASSKRSLKNLSASDSQLSRSPSRSNLQSSHDSSPGLAGNREFSTAKGRMLPTSGPVSNEKTMLTDHQLSVHRQEADGNVGSKPAAHLSCRAGRPAASLYSGSAEHSPHSTKSVQSRKSVDGPCPSPNLDGCTLGKNLGNNFCNQQAPPQPLGTNQSQDSKNGQFLHMRADSLASSADLNSGFLGVVDNVDHLATRPTLHRKNNGWGQKGMDSPLSLSTGFAASRGGKTFDETSTNVNKLSAQPSTSSVNPNAAGSESENPALPSAVSATNEECAHSWGDAAFSQTWPYTLTSDTHPNNTGGPSNFAIRGFPAAAAESLRPFTEGDIQMNTKCYESEACALNDLKNWQVVTRLDGEFHDMSQAHKPFHTEIKDKARERAETAEEKGGRTWFQVPCDFKQRGVRQTMASFVDIDSEDDTDEDEDEDGEEEDT